MMRRVLLLLLIAIPLRAEVGSIPAPRPLSPAEEAAVGVLAHALEGGPSAVFDALSTKSPLRALGRADALAEIETRLGPPDGAKWRLDTVMPSVAEHAAMFSVAYPSGVDDSIRFDMEREGDAWRLSDIHTSAEPVHRSTLLAAAAAPVADNAPREVPDALTDRRVAVALALPALILCVAAVAFGRRSQAGSRVILVVAALALFAGTAVVVNPLVQREVVRKAAARKSPQAAAASGVIRLGPLLPLRRALAAGEPSPIRTGALQPGVTRNVAELWTAQLLLQDDRIDDAKQILARLPKHSDVPLAELLRARVAWNQKNSIEAVESYERAMDLGPGTDTLWLEAAEALSIVGFDDRSEEYLDRTSETGTRDPAIFYAMSVASVLSNNEFKATRYLQKAWEMMPIERADVLHMAVLWHVIRQPDIKKILKLDAAVEPAFATTASVRPIPVAPATRATVAGDFLRIVAGDRELDVPGGAAIAPANAQVIDVGAWHRERQQNAIADLAALRNEIRSSASLVSPAIRTRCLTTAEALAGDNRWADLVALTDPLSPRDEHVPLSLVILRGAALSRLGRGEDLHKLIGDLLSNPSLKRKKNPAVLANIAELFAAAEDYDPAIRLLERAQNELDLPFIAQRLEQLKLDQQLASSYAALTTDHFDVRYPKDMDAARAKTIAGILEAERKRLRASWFPEDSTKRITVDILSWEHFQQYTGSDYVLGLFTNKIFLPIAEVDEFPPEIVALMTHELAHALLAEATHNLAPRWFHEALASRLEMNETSQNAFQIYRDENFLTVSLLDAVANGSPDPNLVGESYQIGETTLRYIEARHGKNAVMKMMAAFRDGATTEDAVRTATGGSVADLDRLARAWGAAQPTLFTNAVVRYDGKKGERF